MTALFLFAAFCFLVLGLMLAGRGLGRLRRGGRLAGALQGLSGSLCVAVALLAGTIALGVRGYRALTSEEVAATVRTEPLGAQRFRATLILADRRVAMYELAGDAFYVDAHVLKWHPLANLLGLRTAYELDRVAGRYNAVADERAQPHTVYSLARAKPIDMFVIARHGLLGPLVDAQYGSGTFIATTRPATFEVRVSTTGLLLRRVLESPPAP